MYDDRMKSVNYPILLLTNLCFASFNVQMLDVNHYELD